MAKQKKTTGISKTAPQLTEEFLIANNIQLIPIPQAYIDQKDGITKYRAQVFAEFKQEVPAPSKAGPKPKTPNDAPKA